MNPANTVAQFYKGKRLSYDGNLCTVRYVGEVQGTTGQWLGVEWDDPTRGKHSGEHNGVRYFECHQAGISKHPTAGSFVRPNRRYDPSRAFIHALRQKYASESNVGITYTDRETSNGNVTSRPKKTIRISGKEVEEVGFEKIRRQLADLHELRIVILDDLCVAQPITDDMREAWASGRNVELSNTIRDVCPNIVELDLSRNLLEDVREVAAICEQLRKLTSLRVNGNRFGEFCFTERERIHFTRIFEHVTTLGLENTLLQWQEVAQLTALFPKLLSLTASVNLFSHLGTGFLPASLVTVNLEDNNFSSLHDVTVLSSLLHLQHLVLKHNSISAIAPQSSASDATAPVFPTSLVDVDLSYNAIDDWAFIDMLQDVFPGMKSLRVAHNPLYQKLCAADGRPLSADDGYMLTLARLGRLRNLNYSQITTKERLNAETYYISQIAQELAQGPEDAEASILARHRRYPELCEEYGYPTIHRTKGVINPNSLAARLVQCIFYLAESAASKVRGGSSNKLCIEIPQSLTVYSTLGVVGKHFGLPPMKIKLVYETGEWDAAVENEASEDALWDSDSDEETRENAAGDRTKRAYKEVDLIAGTRPIGTWVEGSSATIRVETLS